MVLVTNTNNYGSIAAVSSQILPVSDQQCRCGGELIKTKIIKCCLSTDILEHLTE